MLYHVYILELFITLASVLLKVTQKNYYHFVSPSRASVKESVDFLIPFVSGEKTHAEFANSHVAFEKRCAENKELGYEIGGKYNAKESAPVLLQAANKIIGVKNNFPGWQAVLNKLKQKSLFSARLIMAFFQPQRVAYQLLYFNVTRIQD